VDPDPEQVLEPHLPLVPPVLELALGPVAALLCMASAAAPVSRALRAALQEPARCQTATSPNVCSGDKKRLRI
jgi:hypothetical protein